jgi:glucokinase
VAERAAKGESEAVFVIKKTAEYIGRGLGRAASLLNLERYVLGGGVMQSYELMKDDILSAFKAEAFAQPNADAEIVKTALGYEAGLMSAAALAIQPPKK